MDIDTQNSALALRTCQELEKSAMMGDPSYSVPEAARYLSVSPSYLNKERCYGRGPQFCKLGRRVVYKRSALDAWRDQHAYSSTSQYLQPQR